MKTMLLILSYVLAAASCPGQDYLPLEPGNFWNYRLDNGFIETRLVGEATQFQGRLVFPIEYVTSPANQGLVNYWTVAADGDVLLHGFTRDVFGIFYDPPIRFVDAALAVGATWSQQVDFYVLPSGASYGSWEVGAEVLAAEIRTVPAGDFMSFGLRSWASGPPKAASIGAYDLCGEVSAGKDGLVERWLSAGVGIVEEYLDGTYRLETYTDHPVAVSSMSWGAVKALFRN